MQSAVYYIHLRSSIRKTTLPRFEGGVITSVELLYPLGRLTEPPSSYSSFYLITIQVIARPPYEEDGSVNDRLSMEVSSTNITGTE